MNEFEADKKFQSKVPYTLSIEKNLEKQTYEYENLLEFEKKTHSSKTDYKTRPLRIEI